MFYLKKVSTKNDVVSPVTRGSISYTNNSWELLWLENPISINWAVEMISIIIKVRFCTHLFVKYAIIGPLIGHAMAVIDANHEIWDYVNWTGHKSPIPIDKIERFASIE